MTPPLLRTFRFALAVTTSVALTLIGAPVQAAGDPQFLTLGSGYSFAVYANHDLKGDLSAIERVVVVQHGLQRDADHYFDTAEKLLAGSGVSATGILIIAPSFHEGIDHVSAPAGAAPLPLWERGSWLQGDIAEQGASISSFTVFDDMLAWMRTAGRMPHLKTIILAGHSAGGQLMTRYAVLNNADAAVRAAGIDLEYVIANPSSYLYFTAQRPATPSGAPFSAEACPDYDHYRYGLEGQLPYGTGPNASEFYTRFTQRRVTFLFGSADTDPNHRVLDKSCGAEAQGPTRNARGHGYWEHLHQVFGARTPNFQAFDVMGVGHDQAGMFGSQCATPLLFGLPPGKAGAHSSDAHTGAACQPVT